MAFAGGATAAAAWAPAAAVLEQGYLDGVALASAVFDGASGPLLKAYLTWDPLASGTALMLFFAFLCWLLSVLTGNYSWTDRLWSITPAVYSVHFGGFASIKAILLGKQTVVATLTALAARTVSGAAPAANVVLPSSRLTILALLPVLWGARLTFNFARKGGYRWEFEDYRWAIVRTWFHPVVYQLFNIVFIALYQHLLIFLIVLPAYVAWRADSTVPQLTILDGVATAAFLGLLLLETVADQQQWDFQTTKYALLRHGSTHLPPTFARGFVTTGVFHYSRHPVRAVHTSRARTARLARPRLLNSLLVRAGVLLGGGAHGTDTIGRIFLRKWRSGGRTTCSRWR